VALLSLRERTLPRGVRTPVKASAHLDCVMAALNNAEPSYQLSAYFPASVRTSQDWADVCARSSGFVADCEVTVWVQEIQVNSTTRIADMSFMKLSLFAQELWFRSQLRPRPCRGRYKSVPSVGKTATS